MNSQHFGPLRQSSPRQATYDEAIMSSDRIMASALLYLLLGVWLGPNGALHVFLLITLVLAWFQVSRGLPVVGLALFGFLRGRLGR
jgi:hypothetical protein